jgi:mannobiose 2-epimerase
MCPCTVSQLKDQVENELKSNILDFWCKHAADNENGGFFGYISTDIITDARHDKSSVLNARILWTFSAAYRFYQEQKYLDMASRAFKYIRDHFINREHMGVYWTLDYEGRPKDTKNQVYAVAFTIYALSEYHRAVGDSSALELAASLFESLEKHAADRKHGGYLEALAHDWSPLSDMSLSPKDMNVPKSMNTHLHILEAYTNLFRVLKPEKAHERVNAELAPGLEARYDARHDAISNARFDMGPDARLDTRLDTRPDARLDTRFDTRPDVRLDTRLDESPYTGLIERLKGTLRTLLETVMERIVDSRTWSFRLFFDMDWTPCANITSYGHDIEGSWLIHEAAEVLGDPTLLERAEKTAVNMAESVLRNGVDRKFGGIFNEMHGTKLDENKDWWPQAEAVIGFFNAWQLTGKEVFLDEALKTWKFINSYIVDHKDGEWHWGVTRDGSRITGAEKVGPWKCPYHSSRMCFEIIRRVAECKN